MIEVVEAIKSPIHFDIIENFSFDNPEHREKVKKNKALVVGNLGESGNRYIENTKFYKWLDLYVNGRLRSSSRPLVQAAKRSNSSQKANRYCYYQREFGRRILRN